MQDRKYFGCDVGVVGEQLRWRRVLFGGKSGLLIPWRVMANATGLGANFWLLVIASKSCHAVSSLNVLLPGLE